MDLQDGQEDGNVGGQDEYGRGSDVGGQDEVHRSLVACLYVTCQLDKWGQVAEEIIDDCHHRSSG